jgi:hypothetical protein
VPHLCAFFAQRWDSRHSPREGFQSGSFPGNFRFEGKSKSHEVDFGGIPPFETRERWGTRLKVGFEARLTRCGVPHLCAFFAQRWDSRHSPCEGFQSGLFPGNFRFESKSKAIGSISVESHLSKPAKGGAPDFLTVISVSVRV